MPRFQWQEAKAHWDIALVTAAQALCNPSFPLDPPALIPSHTLPPLPVDGMRPRAHDLPACQGLLQSCEQLLGKGGSQTLLTTCVQWQGAGPASVQPHPASVQLHPAGPASVQLHPAAAHLLAASETALATAIMPALQYFSQSHNTEQYSGQGSDPQALDSGSDFSSELVFGMEVGRVQAAWVQLLRAPQVSHFVDALLGLGPDSPGAWLALAPLGPPPQLSMDKLGREGRRGRGKRPGRGAGEGRREGGGGAMSSQQTAEGHAGSEERHPTASPLSSNVPPCTDAPPSSSGEGPGVASMRWLLGAMLRRAAATQAHLGPSLTHSSTSSPTISRNSSPTSSPVPSPSSQGQLALGSYPSRKAFNRMAHDANAAKKAARRSAHAAVVAHAAARLVRPAHMIAPDGMDAPGVAGQAARAVELLAALYVACR